MSTQTDSEMHRILAVNTYKLGVVAAELGLTGEESVEQFAAALKKLKSERPRLLEELALERTVDSLTQSKTRDVMKQGYRVTGFILLSPDNRDSCFVDRSAVRWLDHAEWWTLMHPPATIETARLGYL